MVAGSRSSSWSYTGIRYQEDCIRLGADLLRYIQSALISRIHELGEGMFYSAWWNLTQRICRCIWYCIYGTAERTGK